jgi:hypothetical protein
MNVGEQKGPDQQPNETIAVSTHKHKVREKKKRQLEQQATPTTAGTPEGNTRRRRDVKHRRDR